MQRRSSQRARDGCFRTCAATQTKKTVAPLWQSKAFIIVTHLLQNILYDITQQKLARALGEHSINQSIIVGLSGVGVQPPPARNTEQQQPAVTARQIDVICSHSFWVVAGRALHVPRGGTCHRQSRTPFCMRLHQQALLLRTTTGSSSLEATP